MNTSLIEFGLSEFGAFEFGYEQGASLVSFSFSSEGKGSAVFSPFVVNNVEVRAIGTSGALFKASQILQTELKILVEPSIGVFTADSLRSAVLNVVSSSDVYFLPGYTKETSFAIQGRGVFSPVYVEPETLDIRGSSRVSFISGNGLVSELHIKGNSSLVLSAVGFSDSTVGIAGEAKTAFFANRLGEALLVSFGGSGSDFKAQRKTNSTFNVEASGEFKPVVQKVQTAKAVSLGKSVVIFKASFLNNSSIQSFGLSYVGFEGQTLIDSSFISEGNSLVLIKPGSPVSTWLPISKDWVIRPFESREVIWK